MTGETDTVERLAAFAEEAARYFEKRPTGGEDAAHWANVSNAETSRKIADTLRSQAAEIARLRDPWRPIAEAPKDGTEVLLWGACRQVNGGGQYARDGNIGWWNGTGWATRVCGEFCDATKWQPLSRPPRED